MLPLDHNYHELSKLQRVRYWLGERRRLSAEDRFFFEGHRRLAGQMYREERRALYWAVKDRSPAFCYEIGTASGGGSTYFISTALMRLGSGKLISLEAKQAVWRQASRRYATDLHRLQLHAILLHGSSPEALRPYIHDAGGIAECVFLDGSDTAEEAVSQYEFFRPHFREASVLMAHDWDDVKMSRLRPIIERDPSWRLVTRLQAPQSVGFVVYRRGGLE